MRIGVIGAGWFGRKHLSVWESLDGVDIVGVADTRMDTLLEDKSGSDQDKFHTGEGNTVSLTDYDCYRSTGDLLEATDLDAVDIVVDESEHYTVAKTAVGRGLPTIVEKPMVLEYDHAQDLAALADETGTPMYTGHVLRFDDRARYIRNRIQSGDIGEIQYLSFKRNFQRTAHEVYGRENPFFTAMIHDIDLARWFMGTEVTDASATTRHRLDREHPDVLLGRLSFGDDLLCRLENVWHVAENCPYGFENTLAVYGSDETIRQQNERTVEHWGSNGVEYPDFFFWPFIDGAHRGALQTMLAHYAECIRDGTESPVLPVEDILETIRVAEALTERAGER